MKRLTALILTFVAIGATAEAKHVLVNIEPQAVYTPSGFDDNDTAQIVFAGYLPNTCYRLAPTKFKVDPVSKKILVKNRAYFSADKPCLEVIIPYQRTLDLGILLQGRYSVYFIDGKNGSHKKETLNVAPSHSRDIDEYLYAPVASAHVVKQDGDNYLIIDGIFDDSCLTLERTVIVRKKKDLIEVLPIAKYTANPNDCDLIPVPFADKIKLPANLHARTLFHVRIMNGQSLNLIHRFH